MGKRSTIEMVPTIVNPSVAGFLIRSFLLMLSPSTSDPLTSSSLSYSSESSYLELAVLSTFFSSRFFSRSLSVETYMAFSAFCYCVLMRFFSAGKGVFCLKGGRLGPTYLWLKYGRSSSDLSVLSPKLVIVPVYVSEEPGAPRIILSMSRGAFVASMVESDSWPN